MAYEEQLQLAGLTKDQASLYETLIKHGPLPASKAARIAGVSRTLSYKVFEELEEKGLVTRDDPKGAVSTFIPAHPMKLKEVAEEEARKARVAVEAVGGVFEKLISDFNLVSGKPGVRFFEGEEGIGEILDDSLRAKETVYSYADLEAIERYIPHINRVYVKQREKLGIRKKGIVLDTPFARTFLKDYTPGVTEVRVIPTKTAPFATVMQIYDRTISYITLTDDYIVGVLIEDPYIADMHRYLFEYIWDMAADPIPVGTDTTASQTPQSPLSHPVQDE